MRYMFALVSIEHGTVYAKPFISSKKDKNEARKEAKLENEKNYPNAEFRHEYIGEINEILSGLFKSNNS